MGKVPLFVFIFFKEGGNRRQLTEGERTWRFGFQIFFPGKVCVDFSAHTILFPRHLKGSVVLILIKTV